MHMQNNIHCSLTIYIQHSVMFLGEINYFSIFGKATWNLVGGTAQTIQTVKTNNDTIIMLYIIM